jgi:hypothetical protein
MEVSKLLKFVRVTEGLDQDDHLNLRPQIPDELLALLYSLNGFITKDGVIEFYSLRKIREVNDSEWKQNYKALASGRLFFAQDIFGDQYFIENDGRVMKFNCEGGGIQRTEAAGFLDVVQSILDSDYSCLNIDEECLQYVGDAEEVLIRGYHLAFKLPLIFGGEYSFDNLGIEEQNLHLGLLSQASTKISEDKKGGNIRKFFEAD